MAPIRIHFVFPLFCWNGTYPQYSFSKFQTTEMSWLAFESFVGHFAILADLSLVDGRGCVLDHPRGYIVIARYPYSDAGFQCQLEGPYLTLYGLDRSLDDELPTGDAS